MKVLCLCLFDNAANILVSVKMLVFIKYFSFSVVYWIFFMLCFSYIGNNMLLRIEVESRVRYLILGVKNGCSG